MLLKQKQIFSEIECGKIIDTIKSKQQKWESNDRKYDSTSIDYCEENKWIFNKLKDFFENEIGDKIVLIKEQIHFHSFTNGDYFGKHTDSRNKRIYGVGCLLNKDYDGGEFIFYNNPEIIIEKEIGNTYIFNVNIEHEVTKIESGVRYSMLWFLEDENIKLKNKNLI